VTEAFNMNLLSRINRELGGSFDPSQFCYYSAWDAFAGAVKSSLLSKKPQSVPVDALGRSFPFSAWEPIHTESSYKFEIADIEKKAGHVGFCLVENFFDKQAFFVDSLWRVKKQ
jgi:uncharacterized SAM-dependent methyltransferase